LNEFEKENESANESFQLNWVLLWPIVVIGFGVLFFVAMFAGRKPSHSKLFDTRSMEVTK
jgi:hypothetical protein